MPASIPRHRLIGLATANGELVMLLVLLALAGCRGTAAATTPTATPRSSASPGQQIVKRAQAANLHDATFTITWTGNSTSVSDLPDNIGHAAGRLTTRPSRTDVTFTLSAGNASYTVEDIADFATKIDYDKTLASTTDLVPVDDTWSKLALNGPIFDLSNSPLLYLHLQHATLVDTNPVRGIAVWHVRDTLTDQGHTGVIDVYLRQDTSLPVEMTMHVTTVDTSEDDTILYMAFNIGLSISLPPADQVKSP